MTIRAPNSAYIEPPDAESEASSMVSVIETNQNGGTGSGSVVDLTGSHPKTGSPVKEFPVSPTHMQQVSENSHQLSPVNKEQMKAIAKEIQHRRSNSPQKKSSLENHAAPSGRLLQQSGGGVAKSDLNLVSKN